MSEVRTIRRLRFACEQCGTIGDVFLSYYAMGRGRWCSAGCYWAHKRENNKRNAHVTCSNCGQVLDGKWKPDRRQ